jgi:hypothetical protein
LFDITGLAAFVPATEEDDQPAALLPTAVLSTRLAFRLHRFENSRLVLVARYAGTFGIPVYTNPLDGIIDRN